MRKILLLLTLCLCLVIPAEATDIQESEQEKEELQEQLDAAEQQVTSLETQLNSIVSEMKKTQEALKTKQAEIDETETALINARLSVNEQYDSMKARIKYMYENGNTNVLELFLSADSLADFMNKTEYASMLSEYDRDMLHKFEETVREVEAKEAQLQSEYKELNLLQGQLTVKREEVEHLLDSQNALVNQLAGKIADLEVLIKEAKEEERRRQEALAAAQKPSAPAVPQGGNVVSGNGYFTHPCPGMTYQSSYFGEIRSGIGDYVPHKGHDYAASSGTPIYAAAAGQVIVAGYSYSAGYWVVIDHGDGLVTKYMHMYQMPYVSQDQYVEKGQHIGGVGTTGQSTGNHLHFQVEEYGVPVNPSKYL